MKFLFFIILLSSCGRGLVDSLTSSSSGAYSVATGASLILDAQSIPVGAACATTTWTDSSGSGNNGTIVCAGGGGLAGAGIPGNPYRVNFNGTTTAVTTSFNVGADVMPDSTWMMWIRPQTSALSHLMSIDDHAGAFNRALMLNNTGSNHFAVFNGTNTWNTTAVPTLSSWQFVAVKYSAGDIEFIKNASSTLYGAVPAYTPTVQTLTLGRSAGGAFDFYDGDLAWAAVYPRLLSTAEILSTCLALKDRFSGASCN